MRFWSAASLSRTLNDFRQRPKADWLQFAAIFGAVNLRKTKVRTGRPANALPQVIAPHFECEPQLTNSIFP